MTDSGLLPIVLLYIGGDSIDGATRFQKLVFLAQKETDLPEIYEYQADKYGPFSPDLSKALDKLEERGYIKKRVEETRAGHEKYNYSLTREGVHLAKKMVNRDKYEDLFEKGEKIKKEHNDKPIDTLLKYVYKKYPKMAENTELDKNALFSGEGLF